MRLTNEWGAFECSDVEAARLRSVPLADEMRRAVTLTKVILGGTVVHVGATCERCEGER